MTTDLAILLHPWMLIIYVSLIGAGFSLGLWVRGEPGFPTAADPDRLGKGYDE